MELWGIFVIAVGLSMDAFAVSVCKGLSMGKIKRRQALIVGIYFGGFQAAMPVIGYFFGIYFAGLITGIGHWIVFVLLSALGGNMIKEAFGNNERLNDSFSFWEMIPLAAATSVDALAVGMGFALLRVKIFAAAGIIGATTFVLSAAGIYIGNIFGMRYRSKAEFAGGLILIAMGIKILLEHLGVI